MTTTVENGNFASICKVLQHDKNEVVFATHMLFKYVKVEDIVPFLAGSGYRPTEEVRKLPLVEFVCRAMRFFNMTGRTKYLMTKLEDYCDRRGMKSQYASDHFAEFHQFDDELGFGC